MTFGTRITRKRVAPRVDPVVVEGDHPDEFDTDENGAVPAPFPIYGEGAE